MRTVLREHGHELHEEGDDGRDAVVRFTCYDLATQGTEM